MPPRNRSIHLPFKTNRGTLVFKIQEKRPLMNLKLRLFPRLLRDVHRRPIKGIGARPKVVADAGHIQCGAQGRKINYVVPFRAVEVFQDVLDELGFAAD